MSGSGLPTHVSLFSGVGMTDLAAEREGFETIATAEIDAWNRRLLVRRFPNAFHFPDVKSITSLSLRQMTGFLGRVDLLSGGFPCQDVSGAGTGLGLSGSRSGLWSEFLRVIHELQPSYVLVENSPLLRSRGLDVILQDLCVAGYDTRWETIPAAYVGAPHLRDRVWIMARRRETIGGFRRPAGTPIGHPHKLPRAGRQVGWLIYETEPITTIAQAKQRPVLRMYPTPTKSDGSGGPGTTPKRTGGKNLRTVVAELEGNGRLNPRWVEWLMGLDYGWANPAHSNAALLPHSGFLYEPVSVISRTVGYNTPDRGPQIRALGNGLVPQVARVALRILLND